jgi:hypothetical protein
MVVFIYILNHCEYRQFHMKPSTRIPIARSVAGESIGDRRATAAYLAEVTAVLASMARGSGLDALGFLLEMAQLEAEINVRKEAEEGEAKTSHASDTRLLP